MEENILDNFTQREYKHGFVTNIETEIIPIGLNEEVVRLISSKKNEPEWLLEFRLKAYPRLAGFVILRLLLFGFQILILKKFGITNPERRGF